MCVYVKRSVYASSCMGTVCPNNPVGCSFVMCPNTLCRTQLYVFVGSVSGDPFRTQLYVSETHDGRN